MAVTRRRIGELMIDAGMLRAEDLERALAHQQAQPEDDRPRLGQVMIELGMLTEARLLRALSQQLAVPIVSLRRVEFSPGLLARLPRALAARHCMVPVYVRRERNDGETLFVAMDDPNDRHALEQAAKASGLPVKPMLASLGDIREAIRTVYAGLDPAWIDRTEPRAAHAPASKRAPPSLPPPPSRDDAVTQPRMPAVSPAARVARRASRPIVAPPFADTVPELAVPWLEDETPARRPPVRREAGRRKSSRTNTAKADAPPPARAVAAQATGGHGGARESFRPSGPADAPTRRSIRAMRAVAPASKPPPRNKR